MKHYDILLFDADDTLFDFQQSEREAFRAVSGEKDSDALYQIYHRINDGLWKQLERGEIDRAGLQKRRFADLLAEIGMEGDGDDYNAKYVEALSNQSILLPESEEVVAALAPHCRLFLLTNGIAYVQRKRFFASSIAPYFEDLFISEEASSQKPEKAFYDYVEKRIPDFHKERALMIGDSLTSDMAGGQNAGIDTCFYNPRGTKVLDHIKVTYQIETLRDLLPLLGIGK